MDDAPAKLGSSGSDRLSAVLLAECYDDIRRLARIILARDGMGGVVQATELANEAAIRLMGVGRNEIAGQAHMLATAARTMRRILIDEARKAAAAKRRQPVFQTLWPDARKDDLIDIGDLDLALRALEAFSPEHAQIVELRFMLGLTVEEASRASGVPERTVKRRWSAARAWLLDYLESHAEQPLS